MVRQQRKNKLTSHFSPTPYVVTKCEHTRITARKTFGHVITRHVSHFKLIPKQEPTDSDESDHEDVRPDNPGQDAENRNGNEEVVIRRTRTTTSSITKI